MLTSYKMWEKLFKNPITDFKHSISPLDSNGLTLWMKQDAVFLHWSYFNIYIFLPLKYYTRYESQRGTTRPKVKGGIITSDKQLYYRLSQVNYCSMPDNVEMC